MGVMTIKINIFQGSLTEASPLYVCYKMIVDMDFGFVPGDPLCFDKLSRWD